MNSTELSKYMWKLKDEKLTPSVKWNIMSIVYENSKGGVCKIFLTEKLWLLKNFSEEHLLRYENKLLVKSAEKG